MSTLDFGGRIKTLRLSKSMTQEQLAQRLRVSPQAVSKWENGVTLPDIQLLPELSILLGTSIDALFSMTDDKRMERIDNMLWDQRFLSREEFETEERFLKDKCLEPDAQARATLLLAELYCKRAREYRELASPLARKAIGLLPDYEKAAHTALFEAEGGVFPDWNDINHHRTIEFYKDFIARHPVPAQGVLLAAGSAHRRRPLRGSAGLSGQGRPAGNELSFRSVQGHDPRKRGQAGGSHRLLGGHDGKVPGHLAQLVRPGRPDGPALRLCRGRRPV